MLVYDDGVYDVLSNRIKTYYFHNTTPNIHLLMRNLQSSSLDSEKLHASTEMLRALAHPLRLQILEFIDKNKAINVNKIYNTLKLEQSITSQHLRILRAAGIVITERDGKYIHYAIDYSKVDLCTRAVGSFLDGKVAAMAAV